MRGMVMMENRVVMNVASVMSEGFLPYFIQNIVPKDATGMAITTVLMLLMSVLTPHLENCLMRIWLSFLDLKWGK